MIMEYNNRYSLLAGKNLRTFLKMENMTQEGFAFDYGTDVRVVNRWINNGINKISTIESLALYFGKTFTDFFQE